MSGRLLWLTGAAGAGKTTLARALLDAWPASTLPLWLDGDHWRALLGPLGQGYTSADRYQVGTALARLAVDLAGQGASVLVTTISRHADVGRVLAGCVSPVLRVRLRAPLFRLRERRPQISADELAGMAADPWPYAVDVTLDADGPESSLAQLRPHLVAWLAGEPGCIA